MHMHSAAATQLQSGSHPQAGRMVTKTVGVFLLVSLILNTEGGQLPDKLRNQIKSNQAAVTRIINHVREGPGKHQAHSRLAKLTDMFGPRSTGTQALEDAISFAELELRAAGFDVHTEPVTASKWIRNEESATLLQPRYREMALMSLGSSVGGSVEAEVIAVKDFDELDAKAAANADIFKDKIVLYNMDWVGYPKTVIYRNHGASRAAKYNAAAVLIKSVTDFSIYSPHTGQQTYNLTISPRKIPIAAITVEDAQQIQRYIDRGQTVTVNLTMNCVNNGTTDTRNLIAELKGSEFPDEIVMIGGHIDSWDVGFGVMDDGGGVTISWQALANLKALGLTPRRTLKVIFWTAEEIGLYGALEYYKQHKAENESFSIIMESDYGTFKPLGVGFTGSDKARDIMREIVQFLSPIGATAIADDGSEPDTGMWKEANVPLGDLTNANDKYFYFHHSDGDSITMEDPDDLDLCAIVWTVVPYVIANLDETLPRSGEFPAATPKPSIATNAGSQVLWPVLAAGLTITVLNMRRMR